MQVDHIGYAIKKMGRARSAMEALGWEFGPNIEDDARNVLIAFGRLGDVEVELVAPLDSSAKSPVDDIISKNGSMPYHICYRSVDLESDMARLQDKRFKVAIPPAPAVAFGGRRVVFMYSLSIGLIEIVED